MGLKGYGPADLARLASVQTNAGRTVPKVIERRVGLRMVRLIRKTTDSGAIVLTKEYWRRGDHKDVTVAPPHLIGRIG
ncbi:hypothetical protein ACLQ2R_03155 [Streptosporangium sp. DT93]|uniref:hypothetical protein n=1 Tax=Streptosporangium sp. DT93 TaxID=3393428 RepID=UPI003CF092B1